MQDSRPIDTRRARLEKKGFTFERVGTNHSAGHQLIQLQRLIVNGSLKGYDECANQGNFGFEPPRQALWITHPEHGVGCRCSSSGTSRTAKRGG